MATPTFSAVFPNNKNIATKHVALPTILGEERYGEWYCFTTGFYWNPEKPEEEAKYKDVMECLAEFYNEGSNMFRNMASGDNLLESMAVVRTSFGYGKITDKNGINWEAKVLWPYAIDFGELCYSSDPSVEININWRCKVLNKML